MSTEPFLLALIYAIDCFQVLSIPPGEHSTQEIRTHWWPLAQETSNYLQPWPRPSPPWSLTWWNCQMTSMPWRTYCHFTVHKKQRCPTRRLVQASGSYLQLGTLLLVVLHSPLPLPFSQKGMASDSDTILLFAAIWLICFYYVFTLFYVVNCTRKIVASHSEPSYPGRAAKKLKQSIKQAHFKQHMGQKNLVGFYTGNRRLARNSSIQSSDTVSW